MEEDRDLLNYLIFSFKQMNQEDVARVIAAYLDDNTLEKLYLLGLIPSLLNLAKNEYFWHDRVETLTETLLPFESGSWRQAYRILKREFSDPDHTLWNEEDNTLVLKILLLLDYIPEEYPVSLNQAASHGSLGILKMLLQDGRIHPSSEVLLRASIRGHEEVVRLLLTDPRVDPDDGIHEAAREGYFNIVRLLIEHGAEPDEEILFFACKWGDEEIVELLLQNEGIGLDEDANRDIIPIATEGGHSGVIQLLLEDGRINPSSEDEEALVRAIREGYFDIVELLLADPRVDPSANDNEPLISAVKGGDLKLVKLLLSDPSVDSHARNNLASRISRDNKDKKMIRLLDR